MISLLIPTRRRRGQLERAIQSARATASSPLEFVLYIDGDDRSTYETLGDGSIKKLLGPRIVLSDCWNKCAAAASGDILLQGNDDIIFRTPGWDRMVSDAFAASADKILMVHGDDGGPNSRNFGPHPFIHREWVRRVGYFTPPYFSSDFGDTWLNDLANALGRRVHLPFLIEHMHFIFGKAAADETTNDRLQRHNDDNVGVLYEVLSPLRRLDVAKLQRMEKPDIKWSMLVLTQPSRAGFLARLLAVVEPQVKNRPDVELKVRIFDRNMDLGSNRQTMMQEASGEYTNFIDDDDLVPPDYVDKIYPLLDGVDYIGFRLQMDIDGVPQRPTFHSLRYKQWNGDDNGWYRDISHINPIRRNLALTVTMTGGHGEDARWAEALRRTGIVKTEHYLDDVMYFYQFRSKKTDAGPYPPVPQAPPRADPNFYAVGHRRPECPRCQSSCCGIGGGMRICNQCGATWT